MTKSEAIELENKIDKDLTDLLRMECNISLSLTNRVKVSMEDSNYLCFDKDLHTIDYLHFNGKYDNLIGIVWKLRNYFVLNVPDIENLIWSYEHIRELN